MTKCFYYNSIFFIDKFFCYFYIVFCYFLSDKNNVFCLSFVLYELDCNLLTIYELVLLSDGDFLLIFIVAIVFIIFSLCFGIFLIFVAV